MAAAQETGGFTKGTGWRFKPETDWDVTWERGTELQAEIEKLRGKRQLLERKLARKEESSSKSEDLHARQLLKRSNELLTRALGARDASRDLLQAIDYTIQTSRQKAWEQSAAAATDSLEAAKQKYLKTVEELYPLWRVEMAARQTGRVEEFERALEESRRRREEAGHLFDAEMTLRSQLANRKKELLLAREAEVQEELSRCQNRRHLQLQEEMTATAIAAVAVEARRALAGSLEEARTQAWAEAAVSLEGDLRQMHSGHTVYEEHPHPPPPNPYRAPHPAPMPQPVPWQQRSDWGPANSSHAEAAIRPATSAQHDGRRSPDAGHLAPRPPSQPRHPDNHHPRNIYATHKTQGPPPRRDPIPPRSARQAPLTEDTPQGKGEEDEERGAPRLRPGPRTTMPTLNNSLSAHTRRLF